MGWSNFVRRPTRIRRGSNTTAQELPAERLNTMLPGGGRSRQFKRREGGHDSQHGNREGCNSVFLWDSLAVARAGVRDCSYLAPRPTGTKMMKVRDRVIDDLRDTKTVFASHFSFCLRDKSNLIDT